MISEKMFHASGVIFPALAALAGIYLASIIDPYLAYVATSWIIFGLLALSLDIVWGRGGLLSLGQTAFYGMGGYFGSVVSINLLPYTGMTILAAIPAGFLFGAICASLLGYLLFFSKMGALQSTILTYTFTLLLWSVTQTFSLTIGDAVIGGDNGMSNIPGYALTPNIPAEPMDPNAVLVFVIICSCLVYFLTYAIMRSTFGRVIDCIRMDSEKTELLGYDVRRYQLILFVYAGGIAGVAGALFGGWSNYLSPSIFSVQEALLVPIYVLVGGLGTLAGPFLGSMAIGGLSFWLGGGAVGGQTTLILGMVLVVLVLFLKNGFLGALTLVWRRFLPDHNAAAKHSNPVKIDAEVLEDLLRDAAQSAGPGKSLITDNAYKSFGGVVPVNRVSRKFLIGKPNALIGPNGAGKSSYLKSCIGLYRLEDGRICLGEDDITAAPIFARVRMGLGVKNQRPQVFSELTVAQNLWIAAYSRTGDNALSIDICNQVLGMLGLDQQSGVEAGVLSHGQQQWLDIGMVLCLAPRVVLLDEPAAGMTKEETRELSTLVKVLSKHTTVVVVEHDMEFVRTLEGHVTVLHQGAFFADGDIESLRSDGRVLDIYLGRRQHV